MSEEKNPFEGKKVILALKAPVIWAGKLRPAGAWIEDVNISQWMQHGIMLGEETWIPYSNIITISVQPVEM